MLVLHSCCYSLTKVKYFFTSISVVQSTVMLQTFSLRFVFLRLFIINSGMSDVIKNKNKK